MRNGAAGDVLKVWCYAAGAVLLGSWMAPLVYNAGKALAEVSSTKDTNGPLEWLAEVCRAAPFPRFFEGSLVLAAVLLGLPFIEWLRGAKGPQTGQRLGGNPRIFPQAGAGFLAAAAAAFVVALTLQAAGVYRWNWLAPGLAGLVFRALVHALLLAAVWEILFRGVTLGIFLRAMPPVPAIALSALLFALVRFLHPVEDVRVADPDAARVGFELLRNIAGQFADPRRLAGAFLPPLALGCVLGWARWRTASLALPLGFHAGWLLATILLAKLAATPSPAGSSLWLLATNSLDRGLAPLAGILAAGILTVHLNRPQSGPNS